MTAIIELEKATSKVSPKRFRVEDFRKMTEAGILPEESGWEIIDGFLIDKMTIGSRHAGVVNRLNRFLTIWAGTRAVTAIQNPIHLGEYNQPEPDIALLKPRADFYAESHPTPTDVLLLVEVSDSTVEYDREIKKSLYAANEIQEFWLVNLKQNTIECYSQPKNGNYRLARIFERDETIKSDTIENLQIEINEILVS